MEREETQMPPTVPNSVIWEEIELSESYLVSAMYEEATALASSILKRICDGNITNGDAKDAESREMMELAGMVLVQSLNQLGRASEILNEIKLLFISAATIPVQVLLTGACFQISEGSSLSVRKFLEEFLSSWVYVDGTYYVRGDAGADLDAQEGCNGYALGVDEYMEIVEVYAVTLLGMTFKDFDLAITWTEKAAIPEERRQGLLRRLHSMCSLKATNSSKGAVLPEDGHEAHGSSSLNEPNVSEGSQGSLKTNYLPEVKNDTKQAILKLSRHVGTFQWFHSVNLKFGDARFVISNGKIFLGCLIFLICYLFKRKRASLPKIVGKQVLSLKKALVDLWQLAFSYQVNPLAAVQPVPAATRGGR